MAGGSHAASDHCEPPAGGLVLADVDGAFKRWFDTAPGSIVVLRPDRIVAAVCTPWQLNRTLRALAQRLRIDRDALAAAPAVRIEEAA